MNGKTHLGDPCVFCDQKMEDVVVGPCPGRRGLERSADLNLTIDRLIEWAEKRVADAVRDELDTCIALAESIKSQHAEWADAFRKGKEFTGAVMHDLREEGANDVASVLRARKEHNENTERTST